MCKDKTINTVSSIRKTIQYMQDFTNNLVKAWHFSCFTWMYIKIWRKWYVATSISLQL